MLVLYLAFLDPDWTAGRLLRVRDRLAERRSRRAAGRVAAGPTD
jgi:hypothetical protein